MTHITELYIGLMSGTSLDGIDAALVEFINDQPKLIATYYQPYPEELRETLRQLCQPGAGDLELIGRMDVELGRRFAAAAGELLACAAIKKDAVRAIGSHGQTVRHRPAGTHPYTWQIGDPNLIAELTGITTVGDFRRRDLAAGGQGAPLVPAFHHAVFSADYPRVVLNLGGIANLTWLPADPDADVFGFDTGPGNTLMDAWIQRHHGYSHDANGEWATQGQIHPYLLETLLAAPYFSRSPPKSTGREEFHLPWLDSILANFGGLSDVDIQATLGELTARGVADAIHSYCPTAREVLICGGGVHNLYLMRRLAVHLAPRLVQSTAAAGISPDWVEAIAFAWLARRAPCSGYRAISRR